MTLIDIPLGNLSIPTSASSTTSPALASFLCPHHAFVTRLDFQIVYHVNSLDPNNPEGPYVAGINLFCSGLPTSFPVRMQRSPEWPNSIVMPVYGEGWLDGISDLVVSYDANAVNRIAYGSVTAGRAKGTKWVQVGSQAEGCRLKGVKLKYREWAEAARPSTESPVASPSSIVDAGSPAAPTTASTHRQPPSSSTISIPHEPIHASTAQSLHDPLVTGLYLVLAILFILLVSLCALLVRGRKRANVHDEDGTKRVVEPGQRRRRQRQRQRQSGPWPGSALLGHGGALHPSLAASQTASPTQSAHKPLERPLQLWHRGLLHRRRPSLYVPPAFSHAMSIRRSVQLGNTTSADRFAPLRQASCPPDSIATRIDLQSTFLRTHPHPYVSGVKLYCSPANTIATVNFLDPPPANSNSTSYATVLGDAHLDGIASVVAVHSPSYVHGLAYGNKTGAGNMRGTSVWQQAADKAWDGCKLVGVEAGFVMWFDLATLHFACPAPGTGATDPALAANAPADAKAKATPWLSPASLAIGIAIGVGVSMFAAAVLHFVVGRRRATEVRSLEPLVMGGNVSVNNNAPRPPSSSAVSSLAAPQVYRPEPYLAQPVRAQAQQPQTMSQVPTQEIRFARPGGQ
ncbi:hypothetical protein BCR44DRAFT_90510 [Catenaria anguillulae PL171]|uniref:Uncharacterized protein n=1 Tax=Catenaria anguillulae PL171 TaxID=765915 RepID=A0A1Y2HMM6_9FUNG|nr:hypothetical protein BCR44DRAFT_90510 [Catenaria anguillulae PL171]